MIQKKILVPVNFSPQSEVALKFASKIARTINGMITCVHILEEPGFITGRFISREISNRIRREAELRLSEMVNNSISAEEKIPFEIIITSGKVHLKIAEKANDFGPVIIVMGRSDSTDLKKGVIGSNTNRIITHNTIPVITVGGNNSYKGEQVLLPLDLSKPTGSKVVKTIEVAHLLKADVSILAILESDWISQEIRYRNRLEEIRQLFSKEGINCTVHLEELKRTISEEILSYAKKINVAMIVIMTQQEINITKYFIGSTARHIIQQSEIPILSIIPDVQINEYPYDTAISDVFNPISLLDIQ